VAEQDGRAPHRREEETVEVLVLHIHHERAGTRHAGDAEQDRRRHLERRVVEAGCRLREPLQRGDVHHEEEQRDEHWRHDRFDVAGDGP
jgi:hypothetical protein